MESSVQPLNPGTVVKDRYRITELASRTAHENRYRAVRIDSGEPVQLREQQGPTPHSVSAPVNSTPVADEDPAGPRAKTAELRLDHSADINSNDGQISEDAKPESKAS
ncbi:MAG TPA: hypothetical protein VJ728_14380, partial [Candidatus Binataceae bacterium]|nr:hypothetical protein [Candidatus Binataceae bacterium]